MPLPLAFPGFSVHPPSINTAGENDCPWEISSPTPGLAPAAGVSALRASRGPPLPTPLI